MLPETSMSAWIPALHAGMTELRGPCVDLSETPLVNDAIFSKELTKTTRGLGHFCSKLRALRTTILENFRGSRKCSNGYPDCIGAAANSPPRRGECRVKSFDYKKLRTLRARCLRGENHLFFCLRLCRPTSAPGRAPLPKPVQEKISPGRPLFSLPSPIWQPQAAPRHPLLQRQWNKDRKTDR
jgi:hypothetical protein